MTLTPDRIGDKGQRFALHVVGWPKEGDNVIAYGSDKWALSDKGYALLTTHPRVTSAWLTDRLQHEIIEIEK